MFFLLLTLLLLPCSAVFAMNVNRPEPDRARRARNGHLAPRGLFQEYAQGDDQIQVLDSLSRTAALMRQQQPSQLSAQRQPQITIPKRARDSNSSF
jgi:hypothetical protein